MHIQHKTQLTPDHDNGMTCGIYKIKNLKNDKVYIGQSVQVERRWYEHERALNKNEHHNKYFQRSWNAHGAKNFEFTLLEECNQDELNEREVFYINHYKSSINKFGYNLTEGGDGSVGFKHTEESKRKISEVQIGKKMSQEARSNISAALKGKVPKNIDILLQYNEDSKLPIVEVNREFKIVRRWESIQGCSRETGLLATNIVKCLKRKHKTCGGNTFFYASEWDDGKITTDEIKSRFEKVKPVKDSIVKLSLSGDYISEERSLKGYIDRGYCKNKIAQCCKGHVTEYSGFKWMYKKDYNKIILN